MRFDGWDLCAVPAAHSTLAMQIWPKPYLAGIGLTIGEGRVGLDLGGRIAANDFE